MTAVSGIPSHVIELAKVSTAWPFEEARKLVARLEKNGSAKEVLFETGYGPSGLPHIGTFGEVARTTMVRHAFRVITEDKVPTRLLCFSDDMDGLRKVPDNVPNREVMEHYLGLPLSRVPDPFGSPEGSFGAANNARLRAFLDQFGFSYEFASATAYYTSGRFDETLLKMLAAYDQVMEIILPTLGPERRATYSPFLPVCPRTGIVLQVPMIDRDVAAGTVTYIDPKTGERMTTPVTGGRVKCQWKADWALRWVALGVDYEMAGKDLIDSVTLSSKIARALGAEPPEGFNYELFLDEEGRKISKSLGNGLTIEDWLRYASPESLSLFMYQSPRSAKRLHFDVIPRNVDDYLAFIEKFPNQEPKDQLLNPAWHIHSGNPPPAERIGLENTQLAFSMLLNIASVSNAETAEQMWGFIRQYAPGVGPDTHPRLGALVGYAVAYYHDFVKPQKVFVAPDETARKALLALDDALAAMPADATSDVIQASVYEVGRSFYPDTSGKAKSPDGRPGVSQAWFVTLYKTLIGQERGPRFGSFVAVYGIDGTRGLIAKALANELAAA
ncbi:lysine--tRNA ligase [Flaviflagellibacter deserti]|uniref:Lysine--tRNA ligase n=1 Tax=Flaviflagellibacter deserti TaxID=2267266 RepID=A0ABV9Z3J7_9HYPH